MKPKRMASLAELRELRDVYVENPNETSWDLDFDTMYDEDEEEEELEVG